MGSIVYTIIIGAVIGVLARFFKPGADPMGWILTILLGIAGAYVGSLLYAGGGMIGFIVSIICAVVLLFLYEIIRSKTAKR
ncbi:GlsB/YeaQ/YmgE family stress response membrane protein [Lysobacter sp. CCNWLW3]|uniref:GlsB/YeaQ/YmgE family stress response membrane protein n=1 Tax=unclassified Lysobacter TaxID=2635362 RepID=UPI00307FA355